MTKTISLSDKTKTQFDRKLIEFQGLTKTLQTRESFTKFLLSIYDEFSKEGLIQASNSLMQFKDKYTGED